MKKLLISLLITAVLSGCKTTATRVATTPTASATVIGELPPTPPITPRADPSLIPTPTSGVVSTVPIPAVSSTPAALPTKEQPAGMYIGATSGMPIELVAAVRALSENDSRWAYGDINRDPPLSAFLTVESENQIAEWIYAVAAPFATTRDSIGEESVLTGWETGGNELGRLILDRETADMFSLVWGPLPGSVLIVGDSELVDALWSNRPSWTIMPFHQLKPELKVLSVDGISPLERSFASESYPLVVPIGYEGDPEVAAELTQKWSGPASNRDPDRLTTVALTGVTALTRATAYQMELNGITAPGNVVGPVLRSADIAHVSHEVSFSPDCPFPNPVGDTVFCAREKYLELLTDIGTDVVELTGNHVNDWGRENFLHSIELYDQAGIAIFGGGINLAAAQEPALFEHNGNQIAFVGCNPVGPQYAWATDSAAGSRPCDYPAFFTQIGELADVGYLVIATLQYAEFYFFQPTERQRIDFKAVADAGAVAVSGSQGHHAQGFDFQNGSFIHFGLGNLFFDQMDMLGTRQSLIDRYFIYDGRLLSVQLFTSMIENYCCPREMTALEREELLGALFAASGW